MNDHEGKRFFDAGIDTLFRLYVAGEEWAVKEVHNRCFGRVPLEAAVTVSTSAREATPDELLARLDAPREEARQLQCHHPPIIDAEMTLLPALVSIPNGIRTLVDN